MALSITTTATDAGALVSVSGEVDVSNAPELRDALDAALEAAPAALEADIAEVSYMDSTAIGVLVGVAHRAEEAGVKFSVQRPQRNVRRVLDLLGLVDVLGVSE